MNVVDAAVYTALNVAGVTAAAPGGVHRHRAPTGTAFPYVLFHKTEGDDNYNLANSPAVTGLTYLVKVVDRGLSAAAAHTALAACDTALNGVALSVTGHATLRCRRVRHIDYVEDTDAVATYQHVGYEYDILLDPN